MIRRVSDALSVVRFKHRKTPNLHFYTDSSVTVVTVSGSVAYSLLQYLKHLQYLHCALMSFAEQYVCILRCDMGEEEGEEVAMSPEASRRITSIASSVAEQVDRAVCAAVQAISPGQIQCTTCLLYTLM